MIRMTLGTASAGGIALRPAMFMALAARFNPRQKDVRGLAAFWRSRVARCAGQQTMGIVAKLGMQEPARWDGGLRHHGQRGYAYSGVALRRLSFNHHVAELAAFVE